MARRMYRLSESDRAYPAIIALPFDPAKIGYEDNTEGMTFGMAKECLIETIRSQRDHWAEQLRIAKALKESDIPDYGSPLMDVLSEYERNFNRT